MKTRTGCWIGLGAGVLVLWAMSAMFFGHCVLEGELVDTPGGPRPIESLKEGDVVLTSGPTGRLEPGEIVGVRSSMAHAWFVLELEGGGALKVTAAHPVATPRGWIEARDLRAGDRVRTTRGERAIAMISKVSGRARVFDLSVSPNPNFFASGVLVHNKMTETHLGRRSASGSLLTLAHAEEDLRENDRDGNRKKDYWVRDVAGLYYMKPAEEDEALKLIETRVANADEAPDRQHPAARVENGGFAVVYGYCFRALTYYEDASGKPILYDLGDGRNPSKFGFVAFPVGPKAATQPTFIMDERRTRYAKKLDGSRVDTFPRDPEGQGWKKD